jgi:glutamate racemase
MPKSPSERLKQNVQQDNQRTTANKRMCSTLLELVENEKIDNDYDKEFIERVNTLLTQGKVLSENQEKYLEKCFHDKY